MALFERLEGLDGVALEEEEVWHWGWALRFQVPAVSNNVPFEKRDVSPQLQFQLPPHLSTIESFGPLEP